MTAAGCPKAKCLLATGREPCRLPVPFVLESVVQVLRDLRDAEALRARLVPGAHSAVMFLPSIYPKWRHVTPA
jgi:hypothetical protein